MEPWLENFALTNLRRSVDTAHDLKTPLNVVALNLELLRMRMRKIAGDDDQKLSECARAIEQELRRMGQIFDAFFLLSTPPGNGEPPVALDVAPIAAEEAASHGFALAAGGEAIVVGHESRIRQGCKLFFEGAAKLLRHGQRSAVRSGGAGRYAVTVAGRPVTDELDLTKVFKFYYSDPDGSPNLSLATARLIAETYGGEAGASANGDRDTVNLGLSFPLGAR
jgi:signal transduction histidine kinase